MENFLTTLRIQNFKSLKDVELRPRRVNLLIGKPNAGKSNLLEAISLLGGVAYGQGLADFMRFENVRNLFYDDAVTERKILIESNLGGAMLTYEPGNITLAYLNNDAIAKQQDYAVSQQEAPWPETRRLGYLDGFPGSLVTQLDAAGNYISEFKGDATKEPIKKYAFKTDKQNKYLAVNSPFLWPPYGENLIDVLQQHRKLRREVADFFAENGLQLVFRTAENKLEIQKVVDGSSYTYPYLAIADTLQRIIFYLSAIESNANSVLLFEEPEAHTFPLYTALLGQRIVQSSQNQFFIATHSQYLTNEVLDTMLRDNEQADEVAVFLTYYEDYQTKIKQLTPQEMQQLLGQQDTRMDMFFNLSRFVPGPNLYA